MVRIIIVAVVLLLAVAGGGGFWYWTTTPLYSLEQIKEAATTHDVSKFQMYFNIDQVADSMVKDLLASPIRKVLGGEVLEQFLSSGQVSEATVRHEVASGIAGDIKILVETGKFPEPAGGMASKVSMGSLDQRLGISTLTLKKMQDIKVSGKTATVTMILHNEKFNTDLDMLGELENRDGYWQATRIVNVVECFQKLFELEAKSTKSMRTPHAHGAITAAETSSKLTLRFSRSSLANSTVCSAKPPAKLTLKFSRSPLADIIACNAQTTGFWDGQVNDHA